jgi:YVTN family beta-propeller protein
MTIFRFVAAFVAGVSLASLAVAEAPVFSVYVTNERSGDVTVIDGARGVVRATWPVGKRPRGVHLSPDSRRLYVAVSGSPIMAPGAHAERAAASAPDKSADGIAEVDVATGKVLRKLSVGSDPEQFAITPDGRWAIVSNEDEGTASCWDLATGDRVFSTRVADEPEGVALDRRHAEVYVTCEQTGDVFVLNRTNGTEIAHFRVRGRPRSVAFLPNADIAYVPAEGEHEVSVVDTAAHRVQSTISIPGRDVLPMCAVASPKGDFVYVSTGRGNTVAVIDTAARTVAATVPVGERPWGIALSPDGKILFAANGRSNDVSMVNVATRRETARIKVGTGPWGIAIGVP